MKKAVIYYQSKKGTTKYFGEEINDYLKTQGIDTQIFSIYDAKPEQIESADMVFLGCWTSGLFIMLQHPDKPWITFAKNLPALDNRKIALFTTYKLATGSMFKNMLKQLNGKAQKAALILKSKSDKLTSEHKNQIQLFLNA